MVGGLGIELLVACVSPLLEARSGDPSRARTLADVAAAQLRELDRGDVTPAPARELAWLCLSEAYFELGDPYAASELARHDRVRPAPAPLGGHRRAPGPPNDPGWTAQSRHRP